MHDKTLVSEGKNALKELQPNLVLHIIYVVIHSIFFNKTNQEILTEKCVGAGFLSRAERERDIGHFWYLGLGLGLDECLWKEREIGKGYKYAKEVCKGWRILLCKRKRNNKCIYIDGEYGGVVLMLMLLIARGVADTWKVCLDGVTPSSFHATPPLAPLSPTAILCTKIFHTTI